MLVVAVTETLLWDYLEDLNNVSVAPSFAPCGA